MKIMKKLILVSIIATSLIGCKKNEIADAANTIQKADSLLTEAKEHINTIDSAANSIMADSVSIPQLISEKEKIGQIFDDHKKSLDSLTVKINGFKNDIDKEKIQKSIDSIKALVKKVPVNRTKETVTKIIYKDKKPTEQAKPVEPKLIKNGQIELNVENLALAKDQIKNELEKFDASIKTENLSGNEEYQTYYITVKVPLQKFDYLIESLTQNIGNVKSKNMEVIGSHHNDNTICNLEITLYQNPGMTTAKKPETFTEKSWNAIASGGGALGNIFLFLLPFWPVFLIAGIGFYFFKKKQKQNNTSKSTEE